MRPSPYFLFFCLGHNSRSNLQTSIYHMKPAISHRRNIRIHASLPPVYSHALDRAYPAELSPAYP